MRYFFTLLLMVLLTWPFQFSIVFGQSPTSMSYQAVVRDENNALLTNRKVGLQISILQGYVDGAVVYTETQTPTTNTNGLLSVEIGVETDFATIDLSNGPYFIKTGIDPEGGTNYTITGLNQLLSVPYALYAKTAETVSGTITETDPEFIAWDKSTGISIAESQISDLQSYLTSESDPAYTASQAANITAIDIVNLGNLSGTNTGDQDLSTLASKSNVLELDNTTVFTPDADYEPATKKYVDDNAGGDAETDPTYTASQAANITATDITNLGNLSGTNTGDQDLSALASKSNVLELNNITVFTPDADYEPATKKYVDDNAGGGAETDPEFTAWDKSTGVSIAESQISDLQSYLTSEGDPTYTASQAAFITATDVSNLANLSGANTGDQDLSALALKNNVLELDNITVFAPDADYEPATKKYVDEITITESQISDLQSYLTSESDPAYATSQAAFITATDVFNLENLSGTNTGDQDLSLLALKSNVLELDNITLFIPNADYEPATKKYVDEITITESQISDLQSYIASETDPIYIASPAANVTAGDVTNLGNLSGMNTGDQNLSTLALKSNVLELNNTTPFTPDADYEPATKKYVDDNAGGGGVSSDEAGLKIIRGTVNANGTIAYGSGFTVVKGATGLYTINFSSSFSGVPTPTVSILNADNMTDATYYVAFVYSVAVGSFNVRVGSYFDTADVNGQFTFIVAGPE